MTPLAALEPYMAAAAASFRMVTFSMSLGLMLPMPLTKMSSNPPAFICSEDRSGVSFCIGTPSTTHSGLELPERLLTPRMRMLDCCPGRPEVACMATPATSPCISDATDVIGLLLNVSEESMPTEPVILLVVVWEYPVTTTCSRKSASYSSVTVRLEMLLPLTGISTLFIPMNENTRVRALSGSSRENLPSRSVWVPLPGTSLTTTPAPMSGSPWSSLTIPRAMRPPWAYSPRGISSAAIKRKVLSVLFMDVLIFCSLSI